MEAAVTVDSKGRIVIPRELRERMGIGPGSRLRVRFEDGRLVLEPIASVAQRYFGRIRVNASVGDVDRVLVEALGEAVGEEA